MTNGCQLSKKQLNFTFHNYNNKEVMMMKTVLYVCAFISGIIFLYELSWLGKSSLAPIIIALSLILTIVCGYLGSKEK